MAFCVKCGAKLPDGAKFCSSCGTPVSADEPVQMNEVRMPDSKGEVELSEWEEFVPDGAAPKTPEQPAVPAARPGATQVPPAPKAEKPAKQPAKAPAKGQKKSAEKKAGRKPSGKDKGKEKKKSKFVALLGWIIFFIVFVWIVSLFA